MPKQIVIVHEARLLQIQTEHNSEEGLVNLKPGANEVDAEWWAKARALKTTQRYLDTPTTNPELRDTGRKMIEEGKILVDGKGTKALKPAQVKQIVAETFDRVLLKKWGDDDERKEVREAIEQRMEQLDGDEATSKKAGKGAPRTV